MQILPGRSCILCFKTITLTAKNQTFFLPKTWVYRCERLSPPQSKSEIFLSPQIQFLHKSTYPLFVTFPGVTPDSLEIFAWLLNHNNFETLFYIRAKFHNLYSTNLRDIGLQSWKNPKKSDFYDIFYHVNKDVFSYKGLPIEKLLEVVT